MARPKEARSRRLRERTRFMLKILEGMLVSKCQSWRLSVCEKRVSMLCAVRKEKEKNVTGLI
jgi:hypothetical protein